jgi:hypothetical protein
VTFKLHLRCFNGHQQTVTYGEGFTREWVESQAVLMCGGFLELLAITMPGSPCGVCSDPVRYEIEEVVEKTDAGA